MLPKGSYQFPWHADFTRGEALASLYECPECHFPSVGIAAMSSHLDQERAQAGPQATWIPQAPIGKSFPGAHEDIEAVADEAHRCLSIGAHRGAIVLARAVIEAVCKSHEVTKGTLEAKIDALHAKGVISAIVAKESHEIRDAGNEIAHGDLGVEVSKEDAEEILGFMAELIDEVYQRPARLAARAAKRKGTQQG
jgi:Domain of unknown function (DUF4145)